MEPAETGWFQTVAEAAASEAGPGQFFHAREELRTARTVELLHNEVLRVLYADPGLAEQLARAASWLSCELDDPAARASGLRALGHVSYARSRYEDAIRHYQEALEILTWLGKDLETGRTLTSGLQPLIYLGRYADAEAWAARAREIFLRLGDHLRLARVATNVGNMLYRQDRYAEALAMYQEAYGTLSRLGEHRDVAAVLSNIAVCNISLSRFAQALESYQTARDYCERHELPLLVAGADYNIAYLHYLQGDFLRAIELYQRSREHCRSAGDAYHAALCDLDEAEIYLELNLNTEALRLAEQAEAGFRSLSMPYERAKATVSHAIAASRRRQSGLAGRLFRTARELFTAEQNTLWPALIDLYRAILLESENRDRQAAVLCRRAYRVLAASSLPAPITLVELLECRLLLKEGQVERAREIAARAGDRLRDFGTPTLRFHSYFVQAQVEEQAGDAAAALRAFESAGQEIEKLRSRLWGDEPKISFLKDKLAVYESLVKLRLAESTPSATAEAFRYIQHAKSRTLSDLISQSAVRPEVSAGEEREIEEARRTLNAMYRHVEHLALSSEAGSAPREALEENVRECEGRLMRLITAAPSNGARPARAEDLSVEAIQAAVPEHSILLEYYTVKGVLYVSLLDRSHLEMIPLGAVADVRMRMRLLRFQMRKFRLAPDLWHAGDRESAQATDTHLRELYQDLLAPIASRIRDAEHLIFAPHDFLHHMPFHALLGPEGHVIDRHSVSYAPSATVFALCNARRPHFRNESLVLGLPDRLAPHIEVEARTAAAELAGAKLFLSGEATRKVLAELGPSCRFIHIAAHGLFRRDNPLFSAIRLGDSHLTLMDLYRLPLSAELVTLSGCSTGLNVVVGGDELLGLMRGLLLAGAHSVLASLWEVNDLSTTAFMKRFYSGLRHAPHKAAALQTAMRELRAEYPHPYYWAPFVLAGKYMSNESESVRFGKC